MSDDKAEAKLIAKGNVVINVRSGKQIVMQFPIDLSPTDVLDLISYLSTTLERELIQARTQTIVPAMPTIRKS